MTMPLDRDILLSVCKMLLWVVRKSFNSDIVWVIRQLEKNQQAAITTEEYKEYTHMITLLKNLSE